MASETRQVSLCTCALWLTAGLGCFTLAVLVAITIRIASIMASMDNSVYSLAMAATVFNIFAIFATMAVMLVYLRRVARKLQLWLSVGFIVIEIIAALLTIYMLASVWKRSSHVVSTYGDAITVQTLSGVGFATWVLSVGAEIALYAIVLWPHDRIRARSFSEELAERPMPKRLTKRPRCDSVITSTRPTTASTEEPVSSAFSTYSSISPVRNLRSSISQALIRPMTSKTKFLFRDSMASKDTLEHSVHSRGLSMVQDDDFEDWRPADTEDTPTRPDPSFQRSQLEPIPGSRSPSPANALDGPFANDNEAVYESPTRSLRRMASSRQSSVQTISQPQSRPGSQAHIHPLFRAESPVPPPLASPNTVITASPMAGQIVDPESQPWLPRRSYSMLDNRRATTLKSTNSTSSLRPATTRDAWS